MRADQKRRARNLNFASELKTLTQKFDRLVKSKQKDQAKGALSQLLKRLDQAAGKKIIHRKTADRKKSRLSKQLTRAGAFPSETQSPSSNRS